MPIKDPVRPALTNYTSNPQEKARRGFDVNQFKSIIAEKDVIRTNQFLMSFTVPPGLYNLSGATQQTLSTVRRLEYWCEVSYAPGINITTTAGRKWTYGPAERRPFVTSFNDLIVTFYEDAQSDNFRFINRWMRLINNSTRSFNSSTVSAAKTNGNVAQTDAYELSYRKDFVTDTQLHIFNSVGTLARVINFVDLFPIAISDAPLNWSDTNSLLRLTVNFTFVEWFEIEPSEASLQYTK